MIQPNTVTELKEFNDSPFLILSVYLGTDTLQAPSAEMLLTQLHSLIHQNLDNDQRVIFKDDIERIEKYLGNYIPTARSIVFFTAGKNLWEVANLEFSMPANLSVGNSPAIKPLVKSLQTHSKYLVLLVDREKARMFSVEQGEIVDRSQFIRGFVPQRVKSTGRDGVLNQSDTNSRRNETLLKRHIDMAAKAVIKFVNANDINFVIIGGHAEMFKKVADSLPANLKSKVVAGFVTEVNIPLNDILIESKKIAATIN
jgi:hypothetical protein